jgi:hypothetical protein
VKFLHRSFHVLIAYWMSKNATFIKYRIFLDLAEFFSKTSRQFFLRPGNSDMCLGKPKNVMVMAITDSILCRTKDDGKQKPAVFKRFVIVTPNLTVGFLTKFISHYIDFESLHFQCLFNFETLLQYSKLKSTQSSCWY